MILDYLGGSYVIMRVLRRQRQGGQQRRSETKRALMILHAAFKIEERAMDPRMCMT